MYFRKGSLLLTKFGSPSNVEDKPSPSESNYIASSITSWQPMLLKPERDLLYFISSLYEFFSDGALLLVSACGKVEVIVKDSKSVQYNLTKEEIEGAIKKLEESLKKDPNNEEIKVLKKSLKELLDEIGDKDSITYYLELLGQFMHKKGQDKQVYLYLRSICPDGSNRLTNETAYDKDLITELVHTYVHEMFHAYYDTRVKKGECHTAIEEAIVEYSTLKYLNSVVKAVGEVVNEDEKDRIKQLKNLENFKFDDILNNARSYRKCIGLGAYAFGVYLYENLDRIAPGVDLIQTYKDAKIDASKMDDVNAFEKKFKASYPFGEEEKYAKLLLNILGVKVPESHQNS